MKRLGDAYDALCDLENLTRAFGNVQKSKARRPDVAAFRANLPENLAAIRESLLSGEYGLGHYHTFKVYDPKERLISAAPVRERVIHHAIINVCGDRMERALIDDSFACRRGKGQWAAVERACSFARRWPWCLKLDIRSYFDSIDHRILQGILRRLIKDPRLLRLLEALLDSYEVSPGKGLPIGNLTSQYFANLYLGAFDRLVVSSGKRSYLRYMDDMLVFGEKEPLADFWRMAGDFLSGRLALTIKNGGSLQTVGRGVEFLGCRIFPQRLLLSRRSITRFKRKRGMLLSALEDGTVDQLTCQRRLTALYGFIRHAESENLCRSLLQDAGT